MDNIYAIATAAAKKAGYSNFDKDSDGEEKREEIVLALKRRGVRKATKAERKSGRISVYRYDKGIPEGTSYTPETYKSKKTVDDVITEGSDRQSGFNPPPQRASDANLRVKPHRVNVDEETYEDVEWKQERRDERYQAGQPTGQKVGRRGADNRIHGHHGADIGPQQSFMDVGRTGASAKPTGRTAITAREQDRRRSKNNPSSNRQGKPYEKVLRESEADRKKRLAALSPEERAKTPLQRLQEGEKMKKASYVRDAQGHKIAGQRISGKYPNRLRYLREAAKYQDRKPEKPIIEQREPADTPEKDPNRVKGGEWKGGKWESKSMWEIWKATYGATNDQARKFGQRTNVKRNPRLNPNKLGVSDIIKAGLPKQAPLRKPKIVAEGKEDDLYPTGSQFSVDRKDQIKKSLLRVLLKW